MKRKTYSYQSVKEIIKALDLYSRLLIGQYDEILVNAAFKTKLYKLYQNKELYQQIIDTLIHIRKICINELHARGLNASLGIWHPLTPLQAKRAYDIQQILRYQMAYHEHPEGGHTVDFNTPFIHGEWNIYKPTIKTIEYYASLYDYPDYRPRGYHFFNWYCPCVIESFNDRDEEIVLLRDDKKVDSVIEDALYVKECIDNLRIADAFHFLYPDKHTEHFEQLLDLIDELIQKI